MNGSRYLILALIRDDHGQDLVEYALLTGIVATAGMLVWTSIRSNIGTTYSAWGVTIQNNWETPPPMSGS